MKPFFTAACLTALLSMSGCRSAYMEATVHNGTGSPITLLEVDYPSASFGKETLAAGENFHYRFKILGSGPTKVNWTDESHHDHSVAGPSLQEGQEGRVEIELSGSTATWNLDFKPKA